MRSEPVDGEEEGHGSKREHGISENCRHLIMVVTGRRRVTKKKPVFREVGRAQIMKSYMHCQGI